MKLRSTFSALCAGLAALSLTGAILCVSAHSANAQVKGGKKNRGGAEARNPMAEAFKAVGPTADAQTKFDALFTTYESSLKGLTATTDKKEAGRQRMELERKFRSDADALLTPDQVTKFHQGIVTIPIMQHLDRELVLTEDEKTKITPLLGDFATKTDGMKRKEKTAAMEEVKGKIRETLTPDQQSKLDAMPSLTGGGGRRNAPGVPPPAPVAPGAPTTGAPVAPGTPTAPQ